MKSFIRTIAVPLIVFTAITSCDKVSLNAGTEKQSADSAVTIIGKSGDGVAPEFLHLTEKIHTLVTEKNANKKAPLENYTGVAPLADDANVEGQW